jgi:hypothetical protein
MQTRTAAEAKRVSRLRSRANRVPRVRQRLDGHVPHEALSDRRRQALASGRERLVVCSPTYEAYRFRGGLRAYAYQADPFGFIVAGTLSQREIRAEALRRMRHRGLAFTVERLDVSSSPLEYRLDSRSSTFRVVPSHLAGASLADLELFAHRRVIGASLAYRALERARPVAAAALDAAAGVGHERKEAPPSVLGAITDSDVEGKCIQNLIFEELAGKPRFTRLTRRAIDEQFRQIQQTRSAEGTVLTLRPERFNVGAGNTRGVTVNQAIEWCRRFGKGLVGLVACEPLRARVFCRYDPPSATRPKYRLAFVVKDAHAHAIRASAVKISVTLTGEVRSLLESRLEFRIDNSAVSDSHTVVNLSDCPSGESSREDQLDEAAQCIIDAPEKVVLVHESSPPEGTRALCTLLPLVTRVSKRTGFVITALKFRDRGKIVAFQEPKSEKIVLLANGIDQVKRICSALAGCTQPHLPVECTRFRNQSVGTLSSNLFRALVGEIPASCYNNAVQVAMDAHPTRSLIATFDATTHGEAYDIAKSYSAAMLNNAMPFPVFDAFSEIIPYPQCKPWPRDGTVKPGEYIIKKPITLAYYPEPLHQIKYSANLVQFLMDEGVITHEDIDAYIKPARVLPAGMYKAFIDKAYEILPPGDAKQLANVHAGLKGRKYDRVDRGFVTDCKETATAVFVTEAIKGEKMDNVTIKQVEDLFFVRVSAQTRLAADHVPIHNQIVSAGIVQLLQLCKRVHQGGKRIVGVKVDAVYFDNDDPNHTEEMKDAILQEGRIASSESDVGKWREEKFNPIDYESYREYADGCKAATKKQLEDDRDDGDPFWWMQPARQWSDTTKQQAIEAARPQSCFFTGGAGTSKSGTLCELKARYERSRGSGKGKVGVWCYTTAAARTLNRRVPGTAVTFDKFFFDGKGGGGGGGGSSSCSRGSSLLQHRIKRAAQEHAVIMVDEVSQVPKKWINALAQMQRVNPDLVFLFFGDFNQCPPIEMDSRDKRQYLYSDTRVFRELCQFNRVVLPYVEATARFGPRLRAVVDELMATGNLTLDSTAATLANADEDLDVSLCKLNATKKRVDKWRMSQWARTKPRAAPRRTLAAPARLKQECRWKQDVTLMEGMPVTCRVGNRDNEEGRTIANNTRLVVADLSVAGAIVLRVAGERDPDPEHEGANNTVTVPDARFHCNYDMGFCTTVARAQGMTLDCAYNVLDLEAMMGCREEMYTALTRGRRFDQVHVQFSGHARRTHRFRRHRYPRNDPVEWALSPVPVVRGVLYEITNSVNATVYIGQTIQQRGETPVGAAQRRFEGHTRDGDRTGLDEPIQRLGRSSFTVTVVSTGAYFGRRPRIVACNRASGQATAAIKGGDDMMRSAPRLLLRDERDLIQHRLRSGVELYNREVGGGSPQKKEAAVADISQRQHLVQVYPAVKHSKASKTFRIRWVDSDGKSRKREIGYGGTSRRTAGSGKRTREEAQAQAQAFLQQMVASDQIRPSSVVRVRQPAARKRKRGGTQRPPGHLGEAPKLKRTKRKR